MLSDQNILQIADAHASKQYWEGEWVARKAAEIPDPPGLFYIVVHSSGTEFYGAPSPFFIAREDGTLLSFTSHSGPPTS